MNLQLTYEHLVRSKAGGIRSVFTNFSEIFFLTITETNPIRVNSKCSSDAGHFITELASLQLNYVFPLSFLELSFFVCSDHLLRTSSSSGYLSMILSSTLSIYFLRCVLTSCWSCSAFLICKKRKIVIRKIYFCIFHAAATHLAHHMLINAYQFSSNVSHIIQFTTSCQLESFS